MKLWHGLKDLFACILYTQAVTVLGSWNTLCCKCPTVNTTSAAVFEHLYFRTCTGFARGLVNAYIFLARFAQAEDAKPMQSALGSVQNFSGKPVPPLGVPFNKITLPDTHILGLFFYRSPLVTVLQGLENDGYHPVINKVSLDLSDLCKTQHILLICIQHRGFLWSRLYTQNTMGLTDVCNIMELMRSRSFKLEFT